MKVKLFANYNPLGRKGGNLLKFELEISAWLDQNPGIKVIDIKQSASGGSFSLSQLFVSVFYELAA